MSTAFSWVFHVHIVARSTGAEAKWEHVADFDGKYTNIDMKWIVFIRCSGVYCMTGGVIVDSSACEDGCGILVYVARSICTCDY